MSDLNTIERDILSAMTAGLHPALGVLREQIQHAAVRSREFTGVGFYTFLTVDQSAPRLTVGRWVIGDLNVELPDLEHPCGALLFVDGGVVDNLEVFTYASEDWPPEVNTYRLVYTTRAGRTESGHRLEPVATRDMDWLAEEYQKAAGRTPAI